MAVSLLVPGAGSAVDAAIVVAGATEMVLRCDLDLAAALSWGRVLNSFRTADLGLALYCFSIAAVHTIACYRRTEAMRLHSSKLPSSVYTSSPDSDLGE